MSLSFSVPACYVSDVVSDVVLVQSAILDKARNHKGLCCMSVVDLYGGAQNGVHNIVKKDPGRARQSK